MTSRGLKFAVVFSLLATLFIGGKPIDTEAASSTLIVPTKGSVSSEYGYRSGGFHHGIDYANARGTSVVSSADGVVTRASGGCSEGNTSCNGSFGNVIYVKHKLSSGAVYETVYAHLQSIYVRTGQQVKQGQVIGTLGNTGHSTGPHLHFEVHKNGFSRNPSNSINPRNVLNGNFKTVSTQAVVHKNPTSGIGVATSKYPDGWGINTYSGPNGKYTGKITRKIPYKVYGEQNGWLALGGNQWVKAEHMTFHRYTASSKYSNGSAVNIYTSPNGRYAGRIYYPTTYKVYQYSNGWVALGNNEWAKAEHLIIK